MRLGLLGPATDDTELLAKAAQRLFGEFQADRVV
jgi:hypothetical protein